MSKELSAKEFLKNKGYGSGTNYTTGAVAVLMEQYATARLEAYKAELEEVIKTQSYQDLYREGSPTVIEVKHLKTALE